MITKYWVVFSVLYSRSCWPISPQTSVCICPAPSLSPLVTIRFSKSVIFLFAVIPVPLHSRHEIRVCQVAAQTSELSTWIGIWILAFISSGDKFRNFSVTLFSHFSHENILRCENEIRPCEEGELRGLARPRKGPKSALRPFFPWLGEHILTFTHLWAQSEAPR